MPEHYAVIYRDLKTGKKHLEIIENPKIPIYFTKSNLAVHGHNKYLEDMKNLELVYCSPSEVERVICQRIGPEGMRFYNQCLETKDFRKLKSEIMKWPYCYGADLGPEFYYRQWWKDNCKSELIPYVTTAFADIECDIYDFHGDSIDGQVEINIISIVTNENKECHIFMLRPDGTSPERIKQQNDYDWIINNKDTFCAELNNDFDPAYGKLKYVLHGYQNVSRVRHDGEVKMIIDFFKYIHSTKPDFCGWWNMAFDIPTLINRSEFLGVNPEDFMCNKDFPGTTLRWKADKFAFAIKEKKDFFYLSDYTQHMCYMQTYAKNRKQTLYRSYSLDAISDIELGDSKLKYKDSGYTIKNLNVKDYPMFVKYNIKDNLLPFRMDQINKDLEYVWIMTDQLLCNFDSVSSPTVNLTNRVAYQLQHVD
jgi:hypothetical protein